MSDKELGSLAQDKNKEHTQESRKAVSRYN